MTGQRFIAIWQRKSKGQIFFLFQNSDYNLSLSFSPSFYFVSQTVQIPLPVFLLASNSFVFRRCLSRSEVWKKMLRWILRTRGPSSLLAICSIVFKSGNSAESTVRKNASSKMWGRIFHTSLCVKSCVLSGYVELINFTLPRRLFGIYQSFLNLCDSRLCAVVLVLLSKDLLKVLTYTVYIALEKIRLLHFFF